MAATETASRFKTFAPQFLVDDLDRSMAFYRALGFTFGEPWGGFYAVGTRDGLDLHLKCAPKLAAEREHRRGHEHLDAYAQVTGIEAFHRQCVAAGANIVEALERKPWGLREFKIEDPDGYILAIGERSA